MQLAQAIGRLIDFFYVRPFTGILSKQMFRYAACGGGNMLLDLVSMLSLGGVKGIEFGNGFACAKLRGSENNDPMTENMNFGSNNSGGIAGGISNGNTIEFALAVKPTPSISIPQRTVDKSGKEQIIKITGRHDPCIVPRIIPVVEAMAAVVLADFALMQKCAKLDY